jgi:hypothetical protein
MALFGYLAVAFGLLLSVAVPRPLVRCRRRA